MPSFKIRVRLFPKKLKINRWTIFILGSAVYTCLPHAPRAYASPYLSQGFRQVQLAALAGKIPPPTFSYPSTVALDTSGNVYVADTNNNLIRKITSAGVVTTVIGSGNPANQINAPLPGAISSPSGVSFGTSKIFISLPNGW